MAKFHFSNQSGGFCFADQWMVHEILPSPLLSLKYDVWSFKLAMTFWETTKDVDEIRNFYKCFSRIPLFHILPLFFWFQPVCFYWSAGIFFCNFFGVCCRAACNFPRPCRRPVCGVFEAPYFLGGNVLRPPAWGGSRTRPGGWGRIPSGSTQDPRGPQKEVQLWRAHGIHENPAVPVLIQPPDVNTPLCLCLGQSCVGSPVPAVRPGFCLSSSVPSLVMLPHDCQRSRQVSCRHHHFPTFLSDLKIFRLMFTYYYSNKCWIIWWAHASVASLPPPPRNLSRREDCQRKVSGRRLRA